MVTPEQGLASVASVLHHSGPRPGQIPRLRSMFSCFLIGCKVVHHVKADKFAAARKGREPIGC